jgi:hypothetical protein
MDSVRVQKAETAQYRPIERFTPWLAALLVVAAVIGGCQAIFDIVSIVTLQQMLDGQPISAAEAEGFDGWYNALTLIGLAVLITTAVLFLVWTYRAYRNLLAFGASELTTSPGWAVGSWFVPILNLFRPYQVMKEIWRGSDPATGPTDRRARSDMPVHWALGWWWTFWIVASWFGNAAGRLAFTASDATFVDARRLSRSLSFRAEAESMILDLQAAAYVDLIATLSSIVAAALAIVIVLAIADRQRDKVSVIQRSIPRRRYVRW